MTPAEMARRILQLEQRLAAGARGGGGSVGTSVEYGQQITRTVQRGFRGRITGAFGTGVNGGYPWVQDQLSMPDGVFVAPDIQMSDVSTQAGCVSVDENIELGVDTPGWIEPSPNGVGWVFVPVADSITTYTDNILWSGEYILYHQGNIGVQIQETGLYYCFADIFLTVSVDGYSPGENNECSISSYIGVWDGTNVPTYPVSGSPRIYNPGGFTTVNVPGGFPIGTIIYSYGQTNRIIQAIIEANEGDYISAFYSHNGNVVDVTISGECGQVVAHKIG